MLSEGEVAAQRETVQKKIPVSLTASAKRGRHGKLADLLHHSDTGPANLNSHKIERISSVTSENCTKMCV